MKHRPFICISGLIIIGAAAVPAGLLPVASPARCQTANEGDASSAAETEPGEGIVHLQNPVTLLDLIGAVSEISGEPYVIDGSVTPGAINIVTPDGGMKEEDLVLLFDTILGLNGLARVKSEGINKIVKAGDARHESIPVETGTDD